jgi:hypothetical protein
MAAVPDSFVDEVSLTGPAGKITERLQDWKAASKQKKVKSLLARANTSAEIQVLAKAVL